MGVNSFTRVSLLSFVVSLLFFGTFCHANYKIVEVVGEGECVDCKENNVQTILAFSGLHVTIDCKVKDGHFKRKGTGKLDKDGKFRVTLSKEDDKEVCYAQLHSAFLAPCPAHNGLEATKIVAKKQTFEPAEKLKFATDLCVSATWAHWKHHFKSPPVYKSPEPKKSKPEAPEKPLPKPEEPKKSKPPSAKSPSEKSPDSKKRCPNVPKSPQTPKIPKDPETPKIPKDPETPKIPNNPETPKTPPKFFFHHHFKFPYFPSVPPHA